MDVFVVFCLHGRVHIKWLQPASQNVSYTITIIITLYRVVVMNNS